MKLKLSYSQFQALKELLELVTNTEVATLEAKLLMALLMSIYSKFYRKAIEKKKQYRIALKDEEALAFWVFFQKYHFVPVEMIYEANLIDTICNSIHQKFTS